MERKYRESEKKIHKSPYVDPGESAVDLPQDIIRVGGDLILLKRPITWSYPDLPPELHKQREANALFGNAGGHYGSGRGGSDYGGGGGGGSLKGGLGGAGSKYGSGGYGGGSNRSDSGLYGAGGAGGGGRSGSYAGGYGSGAGGYGNAFGGGGAGGRGGASGASLGSPYPRGLSSAGASDGYHSGINSAYSNSDYAAPSRNARGGGGGGGIGGGAGYPVPIKRSASHGDSSSGFTPAMSDDYDSTRRITTLVSPQKHAGLNAFPVSPADARLSSWITSATPGGESMLITPGGSTTTTTEFKRLYQSSVSTKTTAPNGAVTFNEMHNQQQKEQGKYYS